MNMKLLAVQRLAAVLAAATFIAMPASAAPVSTGHTDHLQCDALVSPLGLGDTSPKFSWKMDSSRRGALQTSYEILVADSADGLDAGKADMWDSGRVVSNASNGIAYAGNPLESRKRYFWLVKTWDENEKPLPASAPAWFEMGLLSPKDWQADWIANDDASAAADRAAKPAWIWTPGEDALKNPTAGNHDFRFHFALPAQPVKATLLITGKENVAAWVNGEKVLNAETLPPWGPLYRWGTFRKVDLTGKLKAGENLLAAETFVAHVEQNGAAGLIALLRIELPGGKVLRFVSDGKWKSARAQTGNWFAPTFDDRSWKPAQIAEAVGEVPLGNPWRPGPASLMRKDFIVSKPVKSARLYATALGSYIPRLNGHAVTDQILAPGWTDYRARIIYQAYDVTKLLQPGKNTLAAILGDGWYGSALVFFQQRLNFGPPPLRLRAQLEVTYTDGTTERVVTDPSWISTPSAILMSDIYNGERYDARRQIAGWDQPSLKPSAVWKPVVLGAAPTAKLEAQSYQPIRTDMILKPKAITQPAPGVYIFDMGQNMVGWERLSVTGPAGTLVRLRFGEVLKPDGSLYRENMRTAEETDTYTLKGGGPETFEPHFTYHGFRYIEMTGFPGRPTKAALEGIVFHTDAPFTMKFTTGNAMVNQLVSNIFWGQRGNFMSVPTDCPQRDERLGWMGDAQVFWRTASYNMDLASFSHKFAEDMRIAQTPAGEFTDIAPRVGMTAGAGSPGWAEAGIIIPYTAWTQYNDLGIVRESWKSMTAYMDYLAAANPDFINHKKAYGDWLAIGSKTPQDVIATAFWGYSAQLMQQMAEAQHLDAEAAKYHKVFEDVRAAFQKNFIQPDGTVGSGSQTSYVLALHFNLVPDDLRQAAGDKLVEDIRAHNWHLTTGFLGTPYIMEVLSRTGHQDVAYHLLSTDTYPSWLYMVRNGATTMWERWNGNQMLGDPGMNSFNHYAYGSVAEWLYRDSAGIDRDPAYAGFQHILLHPEFSDVLGSVHADYDSPYGNIISDWKIGADKTVIWDVTVPPNTSATVKLPRYTAADVREGGARLSQLTYAKVEAASGPGLLFTLPAGTYHFQLMHVEPK
jgi:alpha-L-rhamnosidase